MKTLALGHCLRCRESCWSAAQADRALVISLEELGISPTVLLNPLVKALSPRLQALLTQQCSLEPDQEATALKLTETEL